MNTITKQALTDWARFARKNIEQQRYIQPIINNVRYGYFVACIYAIIGTGWFFVTSDTTPLFVGIAGAVGVATVLVVMWAYWKLLEYSRVKALINLNNVLLGFHATHPWISEDKDALWDLYIEWLNVIAPEIKESTELRALKKYVYKTLQFYTIGEVEKQPSCIKFKGINV